MQAASKCRPHGGYADSRFFRARVIGLCIACPYNQDNPTHCQFCRIRELPLADRYRWVASLSLVELAAMLTAHEGCLRITERSHDVPPRHRSHQLPPPPPLLAESA